MLEEINLDPSPQTQISLFPYQAEVIGQVHDAIAQGKKVITLAAATGSGKTVIAASLIQDFIGQGKRVLFVVNRDVLIGQTLKVLQRFELSQEAGIIAGGYPECRAAKVQIGSVQALKRRSLEWLQWDVIIFDEAHNTAWSKWGRSAIANLENRSAVLLTATPFRLKKTESFRQISDCLVKAPGIRELIEMERLAKPRYMVADEVDTSKVRIDNSGDFSQQDLRDVVCDNPEVIENFCKALLTHGKGRLTLAFAVGIEHAKRIAETANRHGLKAAHVDGDMSRKNRQRLYDALANRHLDLLTSCEALSEGFDVPNVDCIGLLRPTQSKGKYIQQVGRGLRHYPGKKDCLILCASGNVYRFGFVQDIPVEFAVPFSFDKKATRPALKICRMVIEDGELVPGCESVNYALAKVCEHCNRPFPPPDKDEILLAGEFKEVISSVQEGEWYDLWQEVLMNIYPRSLRESIAKSSKIRRHENSIFFIEQEDEEDPARLEEWETICSQAFSRVLKREVTARFGTRDFWQLREDWFEELDNSVQDNRYPFPRRIYSYDGFRVTPSGIEELYKIAKEWMEQREYSKERIFKWLGEERDERREKYSEWLFIFFPESELARLSEKQIEDDWEGTKQAMERFHSLWHSEV